MMAWASTSTRSRQRAATASWACVSGPSSSEENSPSARSPRAEPRFLFQYRSQTGERRRSADQPRDEETMDDIKVILADDHVMVRQGLGQALEEHNGIKVVGEASNGEEAIR